MEKLSKTTLNQGQSNEISLAVKTQIFLLRVKTMQGILGAKFIKR